ncbi:YitT family protein [Psychrobacillus sp. FSL K6-2836]|uniref:YitT family protein n=1 Tax=Psychrobacillus sp. FSL K6-2836 TaxID=2921548 RepID=UPI0030F7D3B7
MEERSSHLVKNLIVIVGSFVIAFAFNAFLVPHEILSSGISGIAILLGLITPFDTGILNFVMNVPLLILGYYKLGKEITLNTLVCVLSLSIFLYVIPAEPISNNILLSAIFGGAIGGLGIGLIMKYSGTSGGMDIIAIIISRISNFSVGLLLTGMNSVIVLVSGTVFNWEIALYTLLSIYLTGKAIDTIYTNHEKLTMQIITTAAEPIRQELLASIYRGVTVTEGYGGYTLEKKHILMMVVTRYEMLQIKQIIHKHDEKAFINIFETVEVVGEFAKN